MVKIPRFTFEKFPGADGHLGTQMKSVGETMSIGRTFKEALQKGLRCLEIGRDRAGDGWIRRRDNPTPGASPFRELLDVQHAERHFSIRQAFRQGIGVERFTS